LTKEGDHEVVEDLSSWKIRYHLLQWVDSWKDQSYFLSGLNQYQLSKSIFPLWEMTKQQVREKAKEIWLPNAERKDSQGLCFIGNVPIRTFLMQKFPKKEWDILDLSGKKVWTHQWAYFYTIGQKQWLWLNFKAYVYRIDIENNILYVTDKDAEELKTKTLIAKNWHWICPDMESEILNWKKNLSWKIRYRQIPAVECDLEKMENWDMKVTFEKEQRAVAPGQVFVAYDWDECLGNGMIA
jgi:tRNA-specific 2-thiouridylase